MAALMFSAAVSAAPAGTDSAARCPGESPWDDAVVAKAIGLSEDRLENLKLARALDNDTLCSMPEEKLHRAIYKAENPKRPDQPAEWANFRALQQQDETGRVRPDGLSRAMEARKAMLANSPSPSGAEDGAGISSSQWTALGPGNIGGRIRAIAIHPTNTSTIWAGSVAGGIWKTTNGGTSWLPVNDFLPNLSVSSIIIHPTNPLIMYAGTGEGFFNADAVRGAGVFRSADGGVTWSQLASTNPVTIGAQWYYVNRLAIHPTNGNILLAATNNGLFLSTDAGTTWSLRTGNIRVSDVKFNPLNGNRAVYTPGSSGGAVTYSSDAGSTWTSSNLFSAGRAEISFSRDGVVYASVDSNPAGTYNTTGQVYRSADGGVTWTLRGQPLHLSTQGWYDNAIWVDPVNSNHLIVGGLDLYRSTDAGLNWTKISTWYLSNSVHADHHVIVSSPGYNGTTNRSVYFGNDGGVYQAVDIAAVTSATTGWTKLNNGLAVTQFYSGAGHNGTNGRIIGGTQDNGSLYTLGTGTSWTAFYGGDGGYSAIDPTDGNYIYGEYVYLKIHRSTSGTASTAAYIYNGIGDAGTKANFIAPFTLDPNNPNTMLAGGESLWRSVNVKAATPAWSYIMAPTGAGGRSTYISNIAVATGNSNIIWVGKNNGQVYKTINGAQALPSWTLMGNGVLPAGRMVTSLLVDRTNANIVYVAYGGYTTGNLWKTTDGGTTWANISANLPAAPIRAIQRHPGNANFLYAGTEVGIFTSENGGTSWFTTNDGPANVSVDQLFWLDSTTLVAATHGRGMFKTTAASASSYALTVTKSGTGAGTVSSTPAGINCGTTCTASYAPGTSVTLTATPAAGSTFAGWSGACTGTASCVVSMSAVRSVTAVFNTTLPSYTLSVLKSGLGTGTVVSTPTGINCGSTCSAPYTSGTSVSLSVTPAAGSVFAGWTGACTGTGACVVSMTAAKSVTATFNKTTATYVLGVTKAGTGNGSVASSPVGISCGTTCSASYLSGTTVTLTATPITGSVFAGWSGACTGTASCVVSMTAARTVSATFNTVYTLSVAKSGTGTGTVSSSPAGISCGTTCSKSYTSGTAVTLSATPAAGSVFAGWSGACTGTAACSVSMTAARSVSATFNLAPLSLGSAVDNTALTWTTLGSALWTPQTAVSSDGVDAAQSGVITHNQSSIIQTTVVGPGTLFYRWKVSSEASFDKLGFYYDGYLQAGWISGETGWVEQGWTIPAGTHVLQWNYSKDLSLNAGLDRGWLDMVRFTPSATPAGAVQVLSRIQ